MPDITASRPVAGAPIETTWGQQVHDATEGIQAGLATLASSTTPSTAVTFPRAYASPPVVICGMVDPTSGLIQPYAVTVTTTGFVATARRTDNAATAATIAWVAIGTPA